MADQIIRPANLPDRPDPVASEKVPVDNGVTVGGATIQSLVLAGRPTATQAEAEAGTQSTTAMTPLTTAQAIVAQGDARFATVAQGALADTAVQPGALATVATSGAYADLSGRPSLGTAASQNSTAFATAAQGGKADTAVQPATVATLTGLSIGGNNLAPIHVGDRNLNPSAGSQVLVSRNIGGSGGNSHGFADAPNITRAGTIGYNSFDALPVFSGSAPYDHYNGFQSRPDYGSTGAVGSIVGFSSALSVTAGAVAEYAALYANNPIGAGSVGISYGVYVAEQNKAATNWAIFTAGATQSKYGGAQLVGASSVAAIVGSEAGCVVSETGYISASHSQGAAYFSRMGSDGNVVQLKRGITAVGSISVTSTATAYNTTSDERLKENFSDFDPGEILDQVEIYRYDWKQGGVGYGPKAQQLHSIFPSAVRKGNDKSPDDPEFEPWAWDASKLVPLLVREVQLLRQRLDRVEGGSTGGVVPQTVSDD